ncbi:TolC family protein [Algoriphagus aestuariicola]|uniref:TolC family protein n=1 Tax=Algoriphagus aestuariicola TaxID=1852016 RepID=A0ABS3BPD1_9BACT|nr:TolC family protein [Algoriphagus aestuariicola]MBN7800106.1 TolC family protein [Algoriphagus aestuariicola]
MSYNHLRQLSLTLIALFLAVIPLMGQKVSVRNFGDILDFAYTQSDEKQLWELQRLQEESSQRESKSELLPRLRAYGNWDNYLELPVQLLPSESVGGEPGTFTEIRFGTKYQVNLGLEFSIPLVDLELWNRIKTDRLKYEVAKEDISSQEHAWVEQLARSYYLLLLHKESLELAKNRYVLSDSIYRLAKAKFEIGELEPLPFHRIEASARSAKNQVFNQEKQVKTALNSLNRLIGADQTSEFEFLDQLADQQPEILTADYDLEQLPEWKMAQHRVDLNEQALKQSRTSHLPTLMATGSFYQQTLGNQLNLQDASSFEVGVWGLRLEWDIFQGGKQKTKTKTAALDYQIAQKQLEVTRQALVQEKLDLEAEIVHNQALATGFLPLLSVYESNYRLAGIQWAEGFIPVDELLQVENEWIDQQLDYLLALSELATSKALVSIRNHSYSQQP